MKIFILTLRGLMRFYDWLRHQRWPILDLRLEIPFIQIHTELMHERFETATFDIVCLYWKIFKWSGKFRLYIPYRYRI